jgi:hypothetical protein
MVQRLLRPRMQRNLSSTKLIFAPHKSYSSVMAVNIGILQNMMEFRSDWYCMIANESGNTLVSRGCEVLYTDEYNSRIQLVRPEIGFIFIAAISFRHDRLSILVCEVFSLSHCIWLITMVLRGDMQRRDVDAVWREEERQILFGFISIENTPFESCRSQ